MMKKLLCSSGISLWKKENGEVEKVIWNSAHDIVNIRTVDLGEHSNEFYELLDKFNMSDATDSACRENFDKICELVESLDSK